MTLLDGQPEINRLGEATPKAVPTIEFEEQRPRPDQRVDELGL
jgi:hypothetical protein